MGLRVELVHERACRCGREVQTALGPQLVIYSLQSFEREESFNERYSSESDEGRVLREKRASNNI
jgi:hypothetical protein